MMKPVDCHCHLDFDRFDEDREEVIRETGEKLEFAVNAGRDMSSNAATLELAGRYDFILPNIGLHPTATGKFDQIEDVKQLIEEEKPPAVGEIGMDYHHVREAKKRDRQEQVFRKLLEKAENEGLPVVVHSRDAEKKVIKIMNEFELEGGILHCFNGTPEQAEKAVSQGFKIGVTAQVLYSDRVQELVSQLETSSMVLETDAPFLYPDGRNRPSNVLESAGKMAEIKELGEDVIISQTTRNACEVFR